MPKRNLFLLFTVTLFATTSVLLDLFNYNPFRATFRIFLNFYLSLFLSLGGIVALAIHYLKFRYLKNANHFWPSVRQGLIFSLTITTLLLLKSLDLLDWWVGTSFTVVIILLELFFQTKSGYAPKVKSGRKEKNDPDRKPAP